MGDKNCQPDERDGDHNCQPDEVWNRLRDTTEHASGRGVDFWEEEFSGEKTPL